MNFIKRAWQNVIFKKGRSLLLIIVMTVIMIFIMAGLLIRNAAVTTVNTTKQQVGATVSLTANREQAFSKMRKSTSTSTDKTTKPTLSMPSVSLASAKKIAKLQAVANYNVSVTTSVNASSIDAITTSSSSNSTMMGGGGPGSEATSSTSTGDLQVTGVLNMSTLTDFKNSTNKITKGRALNSSDVGTKNVVIESELAKQNSLSVGDTVKVKATTTGKTAYTLKVVGIYKASSTSSTSMGPQQSDPSNTIYTSYTLANQFKGQTGKVDSATYTLSDPTKKISFLKSAKKLVNTKKFSLTADDSTYQALKQSMTKMASFANKIVWLVAIAGTIILALIMILMVRERRYEMGVLLSLGEGRAKIIGQLLVEMLMLLVVSLALAGIGGRFAGNALSKQVLSSVNSSQTTTSTSTTSQAGGPGGGGQAPSGQQGGKQTGGQMQQAGQTTANKAVKSSDLKLKISAVTLLQLGAFGFTIIAFAVLLASANILRLEPRKILIG